MASAGSTGSAPTASASSWRLLNIVWVPVVAFANIAVPDRILTLPILAAFMVAVAHFTALYRLRVQVPVVHMLGAVFAAMAMQWTVARAVGSGVLKERLPFLRTAKGGATRKGRLPGLLGGGDRRTPPHRRRDPRRHQLQAGPRDQHFCRGARGAEPALPVRGCDRPDRGHPASTHSNSGAGSRPRPRRSCHARRSSPSRRRFPPRTAWKRRSSLGVSPRARSPPVAPSRRCRPGSPRR